MVTGAPTATDPANTHILAAEFDYAEPDTLDEVLAQLAEEGDRARPIAGGTDLIVQMKLEREHPTRLVGLARVAELATIAADGGLTIGATASVLAAARSEMVRRDYRALAESCGAFSTTQIMVMATIGGNLCNASPAADTAPALLALDATVDLVSRSNRRSLPLVELLLGPGRTSLAGDELLHAVRLPAPKPETGSAFGKVSRVAADISKVCAAVRLVRDDDRVAECRIALGSVAPTTIRARGAEGSLVGRALDRTGVEEAAHIAAEESSPITDVRSSERYRRHACAVIVRDALTTAWSRAGGEELP